MKLPSEIVQNLPCFWNTKANVVFFYSSFQATLFITQINAIVCVDIHRPGPGQWTSLEKK